MYSLWYDFRFTFLALWFVTNVIFAFYAKKSGEDKWLLGLVPIANLFLVRRMSGCSLLAVIFKIYGTLIFYTVGPSIGILCILLLSSIVINIQFSKVCMNTSPSLVFALVPLAKYILLIKEALQCESIIKGTPIWSTKKMKS